MQLWQMFYLWTVCRLKHGAQLMKDHFLQGSEMLSKGRGLCYPCDPGLQQDWLHPSVMRAGTRGAGSATGGLFWSDHICICVQAAHSNNVVSEPPWAELSSSTTWEMWGSNHLVPQGMESVGNKFLLFTLQFVQTHEKCWGPKEWRG